MSSIPGGEGTYLGMVAVEKAKASIIYFPIFFVVISPKEEYDKRLCLTVFFYDIVGFKICDHKY